MKIIIRFCIIILFVCIGYNQIQLIKYKAGTETFVAIQRCLEGNNSVEWPPGGKLTCVREAHVRQEEL